MGPPPHELRASPSPQPSQQHSCRGFWHRATGLALPWASPHSHPHVCGSSPQQSWSLSLPGCLPCLAAALPLLGSVQPWFQCGRAKALQTMPQSTRACRSCTRLQSSSRFACFSTWTHLLRSVGGGPMSRPASGATTAWRTTSCWSPNCARPQPLAVAP